MRLTLRTLLAYLDDTLDASQVKTIGQKVAESDTAQELIDRIKLVTRRRRLTVPSEDDGDLAANIVAQYLDNDLSEDEVAEVEQLCLGSDVQLAEMAACHQILTLVLGEPILIPPTSQQRMYGLVKGREAIPFRKPPATDSPVRTTREDGYDSDETLRMGLPSFRSSGWKGRLILIGGALAACALLVLSITLAMRNMPNGLVDDDGQAANKTGSKVAPQDQQKNNKDTVPPKNKKPVQPAPNNKKTGGAKTKKQQPNGGVVKKPDDKKPPVVNPPPNNVKPTKPAMFKVPVAAPSDKKIQVGKYVRSKKGLLVQQEGAGKWRHVKVMKPVFTGSPLVSLPGFQSVVETDNGLKLTLYGLQPEQVYFPAPVLESVVEVHQHDNLDLDMTLHRGRVLIANPGEKAVKVRLRFDNPTNPKLKGVWDLQVDPNSEILVESWMPSTPTEPYFENPKHNDRRGPQANQHMLVLRGKAVFKDRNLIHELTAPPAKKCYVFWNSAQNSSPPMPVATVPEWAADNEGKLDPSLKPEERKQKISLKNEMDKATTELASKMASASVDTVLPAFMKDDNAYHQFLALRCYTALGDLPTLIDAMNNPSAKEVRIRRIAMASVKQWLGYQRDNAYVLRDALASRPGYSKEDVNTILTFTYPLSRRDIYDKNTYVILVHHLDAKQLVIRELAAYQLYFDVQRYFNPPVGADIKYDPTASVEVRQAAQTAWRKLIAEGKLPPQPTGPTP